MTETGPGHHGKEPAREEQLERALKSPMAELPENQPRGLLGGRGLDIYKTDDLDEPDLNAGISQELDTSVIWVAIFVGYLFFFAPGFLILWLSNRFSTRTKVATTAVMVAVTIAFVVNALIGRRF